MAKIVLIGAGSHVFCSRLVTDILSYPELRDSTISLMDIAKEPLALSTAFATRIVLQNKFNTRIESTTNRREALDGANYVIVILKVGAFRFSEADRKVTLKYGLDQGDMATTGPGGVMNGARHVPPILDICHDMEELCPNALLLNYTNPMAIISWAVNDYICIKNVGLCHSVPHTAGTLAAYMGVPSEEISYRVAGLNHMAWFLELKWQGKDAYPLLREKFKDPGVYSGPNAHYAGADVVRAEIFKTFGYYVTESSAHMAAYVPYFRKTPEDIEKYKLANGAKYQSTVQVWKSQDKQQDEKLAQQLSSNYRFPIDHSGEFGSIIIHSVETGTPSTIYGNVKNNGLIPNLSKGCSVEVPCLVDKEGVHPCYIGNLPSQLAALNQANVNVQELAVRGIVEKDKTKIFHSILLDPLTGAVLTIDEIRQMVDELFQGEKEYLKGYK
jgi:alpha-galactosidase